MIELKRKLNKQNRNRLIKNRYIALDEGVRIELKRKKVRKNSWT